MPLLVGCNPAEMEMVKAQQAALELKVPQKLVVLRAEQRRRQRQLHGELVQRAHVAFVSLSGGRHRGCGRCRRGGVLPKQRW